MVGHVEIVFEYNSRPEGKRAAIFTVGGRQQESGHYSSFHWSQQATWFPEPWSKYLIMILTEPRVGNSCFETLKSSELHLPLGQQNL